MRKMPGRKLVKNDQQPLLSYASSAPESVPEVEAVVRPTFEHSPKNIKKKCHNNFTTKFAYNKTKITIKTQLTCYIFIIF